MKKVISNFIVATSAIVVKVNVADVFALKNSKCYPYTFIESTITGQIAIDKLSVSNYPLDYTAFSLFPNPSVVNLN